MWIYLLCLIAVFMFLNLYPLSNTQHNRTDTHLYLNLKYMDKGRLKWNKARRETTRCLVLFASNVIILIDIFRTSMKYLYNKLSF